MWVCLWSDVGVSLTYLGAQKRCLQKRNFNVIRVAHLAAFAGAVCAGAGRGFPAHGGFGCAVGFAIASLRR